MNRISRHTAVYLTSPHRHIHWLADKLVFTDKWMTSEATHCLVTLTNEVKVDEGRGEEEQSERDGVEEGERGRECFLYMERRVRRGPAGHVWPNRK